MLFKGRVDGLVVKIKPELSTVSPQASARDRVTSFDLECEFVALVGGVVFAEPLAEDTHQAPNFGRFGIGVGKPAHGRAAAAVSINVIAIRPRPIRDKIDATSFEKP